MWSFHHFAAEDLQFCIRMLQRGHIQYCQHFAIDSTGVNTDSPTNIYGYAIYARTWRQFHVFSRLMFIMVLLRKNVIQNVIIIKSQNNYAT
jgi:hypothetical protein